MCYEKKIVIVSDFRSGRTCTDFEAVTTHGKMKLFDLKGKWVVLFLILQTLLLSVE